jgi:glycerol-3-phosphate O-acyltransferase
VIQARKFLKRRYGKIYVQFHDPISVGDLLEQQGRSLIEMKSKEQNALIRDLGFRVINAINRVTIVTPHALAASAILNFSKESFSLKELLSVKETYTRYLATQNIKIADTLVFDGARAMEQALDSYAQRKFIEPIEHAQEKETTDRYYIINTNRRPNLEYYKNNCIAFFIPAAYTAMAILENDAFRFSSPELHAGYGFWQSFFKYEFVSDVTKHSDFYVRKSIKAFIDIAILSPHRTLPDTYDVTPAGFRRLKLFALFLKTYFESYWIVLSFFMRKPPNPTKPKDRMKKIAARGDRMYKRKEIDRKEALSKVSYLNAVNLFSEKGIKGADDTAKIDYYGNAIQNALKYLRP